MFKRCYCRDTWKYFFTILFSSILEQKLYSWNKSNIFMSMRKKLLRVGGACSSVCLVIKQLSVLTFYTLFFFLFMLRNTLRNTYTLLRYVVTKKEMFASLSFFFLNPVISFYQKVSSAMHLTPSHQISPCRAPKQTLGQVFSCSWITFQLFLVCEFCHVRSTISLF